MITGSNPVEATKRGVAKAGIALALGARDRGFESRHPDHVTIYGVPIREVYPTPPGPAPTGKYEYLEVPYMVGGVDGGIRPDQFIPKTKLNSFFIESSFATLGVPADRLDLIIGVRIYRVEVRYVWQFPFDKIGPFVGTPQTIFRFQVDQPHKDVVAINEWTPASL